MPAPKDPERYKTWIEEIRARSIKQMQDPEMKKRIGDAQRGKKHTEEHKKKIGDTLRGQKHFPNGRPEMMGDKNPSHREDVKLKKQLKRKGVPLNLSRKARDVIIQRNKSRKGKVSNETRLKMSLSHQGDKCHLWKGGISFEPYCIKFSREFKERVRAFFGYCCVECGTPQTKKKLAVHHIEYNKDTCCDNTKPLFIALCNKCHTKTNNNNREEWSKHFTEMIMGYYGGKCYLSKEEFICLIK